MLIRKGRFSIVLPGCCEKSFNAKMPYLHLNFGPDTVEPRTIDKAKPEWRCASMHYEWVSQLTSDISTYYNSDLSVSFCPYCGHKLPGVVRIEHSDLKVHSDLDGGYYCGTCDERNMNCECFPEVVLFDAEQYPLGSE